MTMMARTIVVLAIALFAGPLQAGETADVRAWVAEYRIRDAHGERAMTVVRDATRVEYRIAGLPTRIWHRQPDGVALEELHPERGERITYAPGDLRARDREPDWSQIAGLVAPALRERLANAPAGRVFGEPVQRYHGKDAQAHVVELDWLVAPGLPARYRIDAGTASERIELRALRRLPAGQAFTPTDNLRESDGADLGD